MDAKYTYKYVVRAPCENDFFWWEESITLGFSKELDCNINSRFKTPADVSCGYVGKKTTEKSKILPTVFSAIREHGGRSTQ